MYTEYASDRCQVFATHRPSGDRWLAARAATPADAAKGAAIINRAMKLNDDRHYTASARMYARLEEIPGWVELDGAVA